MFVFLCFVVMICCVSASPQDVDLGFCSQIYSMHQYCTSRDQTGSSTRVIQGRNGKQGPRGPPGKSPIVDYERINSTIAQQFSGLTLKMENQVSQSCREEEVSENTRTIAELRKELQALEKKFDKFLTWPRASNGFYYKLFDENVDYATAKSRCIEENATLVCVGIRDRRVRSEILDLIKVGNQNTWIGVDDIQNEGRWVWADGTVARAGDIDWHTHQPDNGRDSEDCAYYRPDYNWHVNDGWCADKKKFLCETKNLFH